MLIKLPFKIKKQVLALGSQTKNTLCFIRGSLVQVSAVNPDLGQPQDFLKFQKTAAYFLKNHPQIIACDLHPEYQSSKYARSLQLKNHSLQLIQHHHAHIASCMAENGLKNRKVIGVAFDGTGLGPDNTVWGAEFLVCDYKSFTRRAHLRQIPLLGSQNAILQPWRLAAAWLYLAYRDRFLDLNIAFTRNIDRKAWKVLKKMYIAGFNSPPASSMGRLFDAVASLVLAKYKISQEAELAMELEKLAKRYTLCAKYYPFKIFKKNMEYILDPVPMFRQIVKDIKVKKAKEEIAYGFHLTIAAMVERICSVLRKENKIDSVVLSGGVFQNNLLLGLVSDLLYKEGFRVFGHQSLSCNDSSLALGQAVIASFRS